MRCCELPVTELTRNGPETEPHRPGHDRRYGLDLVREVEGSRVRPESAGGPPDGVPRGPGDFWTWGETVHAPAPGRVVSVRSVPL